MSRPEREHPRYAHEAAVTLLVSGAELAGRTNNVSRGGLCVSMSETIAVGTDLLADLALVFDDGGMSESLRLPARVVWCTHVDDGCQIGLVFLPLDADRTRYLTMFLRYLDGHREDKPAKTGNVDERFR